MRDQRWLHFVATDGSKIYHAGSNPTTLILERRNMIFLARPIRSLRVALKYWWPKRLTLSGHPRVHAWLWWNF